MPPERKSRGGCARCKERKVKCDESRPSCQRCTNLDMQCPGYQPRLRWSTKYEVFNRERPPNRRSKMIDGNSRLSSPRASTMVTASNGALAQFTEAPSQSTRQTCIPPLTTDKDSEIDWNNFIWNGDDIPDGLLYSGSPLLDAQHAPNDLLRQNNTHLFDDVHLQENENAPGGSDDILIEQQPLDLNLGLLGSLKHSIPQSLILHDSVLVEYYFKTIATFYSCFDGNMNPFRTTVGRLWSSSEILTLTVQSMSAACLCRDIPHISQKGFSLRKQAFRIIEDEVNRGQLSEISLLCVFMLGQSASWHRPGDVAMGLYRIAKTFVQDEPPSDSVAGKQGLSGRNSCFFEQALHYWRMLLSFVCDVEDTRINIPDAIQSSDLRLQTVPHPWALITPDMMNSISEVGRLVYDSRRRARELEFWRIADSDYIRQTIQRIKQLEAYLLNYKLPPSSEVVDPSDDLSPVAHFMAIAEAYRLVALIQIYRVFPDVLMERLSSSESDPAWTSLVEAISQSSPNLEEYLSPNIDSERWILGLALHIVKILKFVHFESHTRSIQAFLLVAISSELRTTKGADPSPNFVEVIEARNFIMSRLEGYRFVFAPKPAQRKVDIVLKVWEELDRSVSPVYWMDVMIKNGWEVLFC